MRGQGADLFHLEAGWYPSPAQQAESDFIKRGLAGAVGPEHRDHLAGAHEARLMPLSTGSAP